MSDNPRPRSVPVTEYSDFHETLRRVERERDLFTLEVGGIRVWERVRHSVAMSLLEKLGLTGAVGNTSTQSWAEYAQRLYLGVKNLFVRNPMISSDPDVLCYGRGRRKEISGQWTDLYLDPIHKTLEYDYLQIESAWTGRHFSPEETEQLAYVDFIFYFTRFCLLTGLANYEFSAAERRRVDSVQSHIQTAFGLEIDLQSKIKTVLSQRAIERQLYDWLLSRTDPELALLTIYATKRPFIESCHEADIPVVELQHGQISRFSYNYSYPDDQGPEIFPDYFLTFGDAWADAVDLPLDSDRVYSVGYPHLEQQLEQHQTAADSEQLLFISTKETGKELSKLAAELSRRDDVPHDIVYKLHPDEAATWDDTYPWLVDAPVEIVDTAGQSVYDLFESSTALVGVCSTSVYEGLAFGLDAYLVNLPTVEWNEPLFDDGSVELITDVDDLVAQLESPQSRSFDKDRFFQPEPLDTIDEVLGSLREEATVRDPDRPE